MQFARSCGTQDNIFSIETAAICGRVVGEESPIKIKVYIPYILSYVVATIYLKGETEIERDLI